MFNKIIQIIAGVLIEKGLKPLFSYLVDMAKLKMKKGKNKKKAKTLKNAKTQNDIDSGVDNMP